MPKTSADAKHPDWLRLQQLVADCDADANDLLEQLMDRPEFALLKPALRTAQRALEDFDFDAATLALETPAP